MHISVCHAHTAGQAMWILQSGASGGVGMRLVSSQPSMPTLADDACLRIARPGCECEHGTQIRAIGRYDRALDSASRSSSSELGKPAFLACRAAATAAA